MAVPIHWYEPFVCIDGSPRPPNTFVPSEISNPSISTILFVPPRASIGNTLKPMAKPAVKSVVSYSVPSPELPPATLLSIM